MKIKTITYTERRVLAQYEYAELTSTAELSDDDNEADAVIILIGYVQSALKMEMNAVKEVPKAEVIPDPVVEEKPKKEKKTKAKKETLVESPKEEVLINVESYKEPIGKNVVVYNSNVAEHKSIFAGYLTKKYDNSWKTSKPANEIKEFTASLNGKHFLDNDGKIVESFLNLVHGFFGA